jgi:hypothetical protein
VLRVLGELSLLTYRGLTDGGPSCVLLEATRTELEGSPAFRAYGARLRASEQGIAPRPAAVEPALAA